MRPDLAEQSGMTLVVMEIPSGYVISRDTIERMYAAGYRGLQRVRFYMNLLVLFFDHVSEKYRAFML